MTITNDFQDFTNFKNQFHQNFTSALNTKYMYSTAPIIINNSNVICILYNK